mgnify:CR=1 FL=1
MIKEHDMIQERILELVKYGLTTGLVDPADEVYTVNRLLEVLGVCLLYTSPSPRD